MPKRNLRLERAQLSKTLEAIKYAFPPSIPSKGWIRAIREVLGMNARQLAERIGLKQTHITRFEQGEIRGSVTIQTLEKIAHALDCRFVYAFVPKNSLESFLEKQALELAKDMIFRSSHTMKLEDQETSSKYQEQQIHELKENLIQNLPRNLWDFK
ncbi:MAG: mobile mystery protein A [Bdellovibrionales bacterium]|nr:mobile mystery protein A [Bdellovibrionales bacterium]